MTPFAGADFIRFPYTGTLVLAQAAIKLNPLSEQGSQHGVIATAFGFGDKGAEFALTALEIAVFEGVERAFHLLDEAELGGLKVLRVGLLEGAGEQHTTGLIGRGVKGVFRRG